MKRLYRPLHITLFLLLLVLGLFAPVAFGGDDCSHDCSCCRPACECAPGVCLYNYQLCVSLFREPARVFPAAGVAGYGIPSRTDQYAYRPLCDIFHPPKTRCD